MRRLKLLAEYGVNNLDVYNDLVWEDFGEELPHIVLVVDDAAQVLTEDGVADLIQQLCQNGRPVGIHVILVTQNPGLKKLAEIAKYHIPARVVCSRLNQTEGNWLLGRKRREPLSNIGEFYFYDFFTHICVQLCSFDMVCYQVLNLVEQILLKYPPDEYKKQQVLEDFALTPSDKDTPVYSECDDEQENLDGDEMLPAAVDIVRETGQASVSMIQRRLKVSYARAARLVDEMEEKGIVGPFEGSKPRKVLIAKDQPCSMRREDVDKEISPCLYTTSAKEEEERMQRQKAHDEWREQMAKKLEQQAAKRNGQVLPVAPESSTYCAHCGAKLSKEAAFCSACGASTKVGKAATEAEKEMSATKAPTVTAVPAEKIEPVCPYCGSRDVDVQLHQEVRGSKTVTRTKSKYRQQRHGCLWWCIIGWWWWAFDLMFWVCFFPLRFLIQLFKKKDYTGKSKSVAKTKNDIAYRTVFLCKNCGHHWEEQK